MTTGCIVRALVPIAETIVADQASSANFWTALPTVSWVLFAGVLFFVFRKQLENLLTNVSWRVRCGMPFKVGSIELGSSYVSPDGAIVKDRGEIETRKDADSIRPKERDHCYSPNRRIFLVHKLAVSKEPGQLYDIQLYVIPHKDATLACLARVEYFLGQYWGNQIFVVKNRATGFSMSTTAYGPLVVTAELHFTDGTTGSTWRYVDFEMGPAGKEPLT